MSGYEQTLTCDSKFREKQEFVAALRSDRFRVLSEVNSSRMQLFEKRSAEAEGDRELHSKNAQYTFCGRDKPLVIHQGFVSRARSRNAGKPSQSVEKPGSALCNNRSMDGLKNTRFESLRRHNASREFNRDSQIKQKACTKSSIESLHLVGEAPSTCRTIKEQDKRERQSAKPPLLIDSEKDHSEERVLVCGNCTIIEAELWCAYCFQVFCPSCWTEIHNTSVDFSSYCFHSSKSKNISWEHPLAPEICPLRPNKKGFSFGLIYLRVEPSKKSINSIKRKRTPNSKSRHCAEKRLAASKSLPSLQGIAFALRNSLTL